MPPDAEGSEEMLDISELRSLLPPELANMDDEGLANLLELFQAQSANDLLSDDEEVDGEGNEFIFGDVGEGLEDEEELAQEKSPPGFFEALDALDDLADIDDPPECTQKLLAILEKCPQCGDAWLMLAIFEPSIEKSREHLYRALKESQWMLVVAREEPKLESSMTQSYIMTGLDVCAELWKRGLRTDALEVHSELLTASQEDIGGHRLVYAYRLLEQGWYDELDEQLVLLADKTQSQAGLRLLEAIQLYSKEKDSPTARQALMDSHKMNPQIADYLLGDREWEDHIDDDSIAPEEDEAQWVAYVAIAATRSVEGFSRWMRDTLNYSPESLFPPPQHHREQLKILQQLSQSDDDWILGCKTLDGENFYTAIFVRESEQLVEIVTDDVKPSQKRLWEIVADAMNSPDFGQPLRPSRLYVDRPNLVATWKKRCQTLGIECLFDRDFSIPEELFQGLHETIQKVENQVTVCDETIELARELPESDEIWHVGVFHPPIWITDSATPRRSCVALVMEEETELIRIHDLTDEKPSKDFLAQTVLKAMLYPLANELEPCVPAEIKVHPASNPDSLQQLVETLNIPISMAEDASLLTEAMEHLIQHCSDASLRESLRDSAEMDDRELTRLYQNITRFYRASLWRSIPGDQLIQIICSDHEIGTFYAVIIGQMSQHRGLVICEDRKPIEDIVTGRSTSTDSEVTVLNFCEAHEIAPIDVWLIEQLNLEVAGEDAYPLLQRSISRQRFRRPTRNELLAVDIAIRCLPAFAEQPMIDDVVSQTVSTFQGPVAVSLKWTVPS